MERRKSVFHRPRTKILHDNAMRRMGWLKCLSIKLMTKHLEMIVDGKDAGFSMKVSDGGFLDVTSADAQSGVGVPDRACIVNDGQDERFEGEQKRLCDGPKWSPPAPSKWKPVWTRGR